MKRAVLALVLGSLLVGCQGNSVDDLNPRQRDVVAEAESFVEYSNMSYLGLIDMLEFLNFTHEEAVFAVDFIEAKVNWFEECADEAKDFIEYSSKTENHSFTRDELKSLLEFQGYTEEEVEYGLKAVGY